MKFKSKYLGVSAALLLSSNMANAGLLTLEVNNNGGLSQSQFSVFDQAIVQWADILTGIQSAFDLTVSIDASGVPIDGQGGTLGSAGPRTAITDPNLGYAYASTGVMQFDTADLDNMEAQGTLFDVIFHEMAHVLGFGTLWDTNSFGGAFAGTQSVYVDGSGQYTGAYALAEYRQEFDPDAMFVPVELNGGPGTADGHWDEDWEGGSEDVMTGFLEGSTRLSRTTIASFADIGYTTNVTHGSPTNATAVSAPATLGLFALGMGLIGLRRKSLKV